MIWLNEYVTSQMPTVEQASAEQSPSSPPVGATSEKGVSRTRSQYAFPMLVFLSVAVMAYFGVRYLKGRSTKLDLPRYSRLEN
jgi:hypothetical protein